MAYAVFHTDHGIAMARRVLFDTYRDVLDYIDRVFIPSCRDGMAHVFDGDSMMMSVCVADGHVITRQTDSGRYIFW